MGGTQTASSNKKTRCLLVSRDEEETLILDAIVLKRLTGFLPSQDIGSLDLSQFSHLQLADPQFYNSQRIDMVLGADVYAQILKEATLKFKDNRLIAQLTIFGWIISGVWELPNSYACNVMLQCNSFQVSLDERIRQFWEIEEMPSPKFLSSEDEYCEKMYKATTVRKSDGRYVVHLPFLKDFPSEKFLSHSRHIALRRFHHMENKLSLDQAHKNLYDQVLQDYIHLGHMSRTSYIEKKPLNTQEKLMHCYLPHHGVFKPSSLTTKLRVVFDASCKSLNGNSLNSVLVVGPTLQQDIMSIILRWRKYPYVFNADIEKMYRQIWVHPKHTSYQRILYRDNTDLPVQDYQLNTVTFGVSSAPYFANRTLLQLADDEKNRFPVASRIVQTDFYVDDVLSRAYTLDEAVTAQTELRKMLKSGGFELKKWSANNPKILVNIPFTDQLPDPILNLDTNQNQKTLGIYWNKKDDYFAFKISLKPIPNQLTKRQLFSEIARLFDPAGWLGPVVINAKTLMQHVWSDKTEWDENVARDRLNTWIMLMNDLPQLEKLQIKRYLQFRSEYNYEIHGFCDASQNAYGAALYLKIIDSQGDAHTRLIMAKTKVAPKGQDQLTIPRLELCGAVLLCKMLNAIPNILDIQVKTLFAWCDSTIVLAWLKGSPTKWKTFVANRVATINKSPLPIQWHHVISSENPADVASRGIMPSELISNQLWWNGPAWLALSQEFWPIKTECELMETDLEAKSIKSLATIVLPNPLCIILTRFSSLSRALRVLAYCQRFTKIKIIKAGTHETDFPRHISCAEIQSIFTYLVRVTQRAFYLPEWQALTKKENLSSKSTILALNPFIDAKGLIRMSGRLSELQKNYNERFPIILPPHAYFTKLIIQEAHAITLHGGIQSMMLYLRKRFWIPKLKSVLKTMRNHCKTCVIHKKQTMVQLMGTLPEARVSVSLPFSNLGVDYAGPLTLKLYKGRCKKFTKGYIALFICLATKAIHLEAVTDLSTKTFLEAFERFFSRRGLCHHIYSDNGTNFVGANTELTKSYRLALKQATSEAAAALSARKINWHFIPPGAPHFGGLWEAGVKSVKTHLTKIVRKAVLTYEELNTVLCRIEACLNSRPITALSDDPSDLNPLTPGHFLRGEALLAPLCPSKEIANLKELKRFELLQQLKGEFWVRWKAEYLSQLQQRPKWKNRSSNLRVGDLVVLKNENTPPQSWKLGRVLATHPGADKLVRVATVKTTEGEFKRPIAKLCLLPYEKVAPADSV